MERCRCPKRWHWIDHDLCDPTDAGTWVEIDEETFEEERLRDLWDRFANDPDVIPD